MALSGNINSTTFNGRTYRISWSASQNIEGNYSVITCKHYLINPAGYDLYINGRSNTCTVDGTAKSYSSPAISTGGGSTILLGTTTHTVHHNADGSKSVAISGTFNIQATLGGYYYSSVYCAGTVTLDAIPRGARFTKVMDFNDEDNPVVEYSNPAGNALTSLQACIADVNGYDIYIPYRDISKTGSSYTFSFTDAEREILRKLIPNAQKINVKYYLKSVIGGNTQYSSAQVTFRIKPGYPTANVVFTTDAQTSNLTREAGTVIKGVSDLTWNITNATAYKHATIKSILVTNGSNTSDKASGTFTDVVDADSMVRITDSRGFYSDYAVDGTLIDYFAPTIQGNLGNPTTAGEMLYRVSGNVWQGKFGNAADSATNDFKCYYRYYENDEGFTPDDEPNAATEWIEVPASDIKIEGNTYTISSKITGLNYRNRYSFQARIQDKVFNVMTKDVKTVSSIPVFDWSDADFEFNVPVRMPNSTAIYGYNKDGEARNLVHINQSNWSNFGYGSYAANEGTTGLYGNEVQVLSKGAVKINGREYGANKVLDAPYMFMGTGHTSTLSAPISSQPHGVILCWSWYNANGAGDYSWIYTFIPKYHVEKHDSTGVCCFGINSDGHMQKYVYVYDTKIVGYSQNNQNGTSYGVQYYNENYVLRYVIGV